MGPLPSFSEFFRSLWGIDPFPWQTRLAEQVGEGPWPEWITLPTGTGKTSVIDIAVYALARQAALPPSERHAPVRIVFAVNRRIVVDEAFDRAKSIAERLRSAVGEPASPLHSVAAALHSLAGDTASPPLEAFPLRGGTFTERSWARSAFQPLVLSTTLDQLGSRLLFRGYGVSDQARPIHAALLANDALLILDEAHTATAFSQTLQGIARLRREASEDLRLPFQTVQLTATPPPDADQPFRLGPEDEVHPVISSRLRAPKPFETIPVPEAKGKARHKKLAEAMEEHTKAFLSQGHRRILVVVNRVATAEALLEALQPGRGASAADCRIEILTGRLRPLDRDALVQSLAEIHQLKSGKPEPEVPRLILIATQCIEVGADFDFDALLTELAPLDNLRQRFGRLNRYGRERFSPAAIFAPEEATEGGNEDPIYGTALPKVWSWLGTLENRDFGLAALAPQLPTGDDLAALLAPTADAPILLAPHLDLLCQTSPEPHLSPDPALYIHGPRIEFPEVGVILRDDLQNCADPLEALRIARPLATEAASVPLYLARQWLASPKPGQDESGDAPMRFPPPKDFEACPRLPVWRKGDAEWLTDPTALRPGDILIIPRDRRQSISCLLPLPETATDQFEAAHLIARDRIAIRFGERERESLAAALSEPAHTAFLELVAPCFETPEDDETWVFNPRIWKASLPEIARLLAANLPSDHPQHGLWRWAAWTDGIGNISRKADDWKIVPYSNSNLPGILAMNLSRCGATPWPLDPEDLGRQGNEANREVPLKLHSAGVATRAQRNGYLLEEGLRTCLRDAGRLHDIGKLDPRFQALLHGCFLYAVTGRDHLAKSARLFHPKRDALLREALLLPKGFRHELISARIAADSEALFDHPERDLLLHLIASHHGYCRGFAPVVRDEDFEPFEIRVLDFNAVCPGYSSPLASIRDGVPARFWSLTRRFGWWGLAYLETLLRIADQTESANPTQPHA
jgi:CRISPR-associated endonuclease/helicase Cas3